MYWWGGCVFLGGGCGGRRDIPSFYAKKGKGGAGKGKRENLNNPNLTLIPTPRGTRNKRQELLLQLTGIQLGKNRIEEPRWVWHTSATTLLF